MVGAPTGWGWTALAAAGVRRASFASWRLRAWLHRRVILITYPQISCEQGVSIDPTARVGAMDGGSITIGRGTEIAARATILAEGGAIRIGTDCHLGIGTTIHAKATIEIGDDTLVAQYVSLRNHDHATVDQARPYRLQGFVTAPVRIGRNVWLGAKASVLKGVTIGDDAVVGAHAVVTRAIPPGMVAVGVPARPIRQVHP